MLKKTTASLLLLLAGCLPPIEGSQIYPGQLEYQERVALYVEAETDLTGLVEVETSVFWKEQDCTGPEGQPGFEFRDVCLAGVTYVCERMFVYKPVEGWGALAHELGHCWRLASGMDGDGDHSDEEYWDVLERAKLE